MSTSSPPRLSGRCGNPKAALCWRLSRAP